MRLITKLAAVLTAILLRYFHLQHQLQQQQKLEALARLESLRSRIRPHFLFNSMNTIASLTRVDADLAMVFIFVALMSVFFYGVDGVISWLLQSFLEILS